jgi:hypothetical protein
MVNELLLACYGMRFTPLLSSSVPWSSLRSVASSSADTTTSPRGASRPEVVRDN